MSKQGGPSEESNEVEPEKRDLPILGFPSETQWEAWLAVQSHASKGLWLKLAKQGSGHLSLSRQEAVDAALCHGWIDGQTATFDGDHWLIRFTPRTRRSKWSEVNRTRVEELIEQGRMKPAGFREVERAKADGRWAAAYAPQSRATVPNDLQAALDLDVLAKRRFDELNSKNRYAILYRIQDAKRGETRRRRIKKYVLMLSRGETIHPVKMGAESRRSLPDK